MAGTYSAGDKTKNAILTGSRKLFYKKGYAATTYNDISSHLKINRALIPYHFNSKHCLAVSVYNSIINEALGQAKELLDVAELSGDLAASFEIVMFYRLFNDKRLTAFACDLLNENPDALFDVNFERNVIANIDNYFTGLNKDSFELICQCMCAIRYQLIKCIKKDKVDCDVLSRQYIEFVLKYADFSQKEITEIYNAATQLANLISCDIKPGFTTTVSYR